MCAWQQPVAPRRALLCPPAKRRPRDFIFRSALSHNTGIIISVDYIRCAPGDWHIAFLFFKLLHPDEAVM